MRKILINYLLFFSFFVNFQNAFSQQKYWIFFKDKAQNSQTQISEKTKLNRILLHLPITQFTDFPVNDIYIESLQNIGIQPIIKSKWLNAVSAVLTNEQLNKMQYLGFVQKIQPIFGNFFIAKTDSIPKKWKMDLVMQQVGLEDFKRANLTGKNITIGVIDAGFLKANEADLLKTIFQENRILGIHDYVNPARNNNNCSACFEEETRSDFHGTEVLKFISGIDYVNKYQSGLAINANLYLARTDNGKKEFRGEEDNWLAAMELMDSLGVRIINTSLGYTKGFTDPKESYSPNQMNGNTSIIAKAAKIASEEKGILVVVAAGNEGDSDWKIIATPADVENVLAVGATNSVGLKMGYSSIGPDFLPYNKPDISCFSYQGTSFATPVITGFAACLLEAKPSLTNKELMQLIRKSGSLYPFENNYIGCGIPSAEKALRLLKNEPVSKIEVIKAKKKQMEISLKIADNQVVSTSDEFNLVTIFYKKNATQVLKQEVLKVKENTISIPKNALYPRVTVVGKGYGYEVFWK